MAETKDEILRTWTQWLVKRVYKNSSFTACAFFISKALQGYLAESKIQTYQERLRLLDEIRELKEDKTIIKQSYEDVLEDSEVRKPKTLLLKELIKQDAVALKIYGKYEILTADDILFK